MYCMSQYVCLHVCMYAPMYVWVYVCIGVCMLLYVCIRTFVRMYVCIHTQGIHALCILFILYCIIMYPYLRLYGFPSYTAVT